MVKQKIVAGLIAVCSVIALYVIYALHADLNIPAAGFELTIRPGSSFYKITEDLHKQKILSNPRLLRWYATLRGYANNIQAGEYLLSTGTNSLSLLDQLREGKVRQYTFTIIEGQRVSDVIKDLNQHPKIIATLKGLSEAEVIAKLNIDQANMEGLLWPETYFFTAQTTDLDLLRRATATMRQNLQTMWEQRDSAVTLKNSYEALILASIIEKESGVYDEFAEISGVYQRRLAKKMRLQADPTVIYALRTTLTGPLLTKHCSTDSKYNTYLYTGLPPTPIAIPSRQAIYAALHPAAGESLYFVASTNGRHVFSKSLAEHNAAVAKTRQARKN